jgi:hypothetical protein
MPNHTIQEPLLAHINQWFIYENLYGRYQFTVSNKKIQNTTSPLMEYSLLFCFFVFWPPLSFQKAGADSDNSHTLTGLHFVRLYWTKVMRSRLTKTK